MYASITELTTVAQSIVPRPNEIVLLASYARTRSFLGRGEMASSLRDVLDDLALAGTPVVAASLGNPYVLNVLPSATALVTTYDGAEASPCKANFPFGSRRSILGDMDSRPRRRR